MTCPDCQYAVTHPDTGIHNVGCASCCSRMLENHRHAGRKAQDRLIAAWERCARYVGTDLVLQALQSRAALRAMAPIKETT